jgi:acyl carrier protein
MQPLNLVVSPTNHAASLFAGIRSLDDHAPRRDFILLPGLLRFSQGHPHIVLMKIHGGIIPEGTPRLQYRMETGYLRGTCLLRTGAFAKNFAQRHMSGGLREEQCRTEGYAMGEQNTKIREFVIENFLFGDDTGLTDTTSFRDEGIVDSTGVLELVAFLETGFGISVDGSEYVPDNLDSIEKIAQFVIRKQGA